MSLLFLSCAVPSPRLLSLLTALTLAAPVCAAEALAPLRVVSGDLPPFAVDGQPERPGVLVELVELLLKRCGQPARVEFFPWARALATASNQPRIAILPLTRTPERDPQFQWLLKLYVQHFVFINRSGQPLVAGLEQARQLRLAVLRGSPNLAQLQRHGFSTGQVTQASSVDDMLRMLDRGVVDAIYGGDVINLDKVRSSGRDPAAYQVGVTLESGEIWLAASAGFSDADRQQLKEAHQALLREGAVERLFRAYGIKPRADDLR
ncbi:substrate-binding periplasmic protein [Roseateles sp. DXS20W]|uniref:Substrate-binding periplasmic protein n=1 Tax=Pelomonas lactea TaxID=3299030 RepID=A0ABW7GHM1_9BURK